MVNLCLDAKFLITCKKFFQELERDSTQQANIYLLKVNSKSICLWRRSVVVIVNFEQISHFFLLFWMLTLSNDWLHTFSQLQTKTLGWVLNWLYWKLTMTTSFDIVLVSLLLTLNIFNTRLSTLIFCFHW